MKFWRRVTQAAGLAVWLLLVSQDGQAQVAGSEEAAIYLEQTGEREFHFSWQARYREELVEIRLVEGETTFYNLCTKSGETLEWRYQNGTDHDLFAIRTGNTIRVTGRHEGQPVDETFAIDERPWYQPLSFSLRTFLNSPEASISFWTIRASTLDVYALEATKLRQEEVATVNTREQATKVEVRPEGLFSAFWHGTYWYRSEDGLFLRYESVHGPLGTDPTLVRLDRVSSEGPVVN